MNKNEKKEFKILYDMFSEMTLEEAKIWLRKHAELKQPDKGKYNGYGYTSRALCRVASMGLEKTPINEIPDFYLDTKYGWELYEYMWKL